MPWAVRVAMLLTEQAAEEQFHRQQPDEPMQAEACQYGERLAQTKQRRGYILIP